jgi:hypothetical protein
VFLILRTKLILAQSLQEIITVPLSLFPFLTEISGQEMTLVVLLELKEDIGTQ